MKEKLSTQYNDAVKQIKTAILQSQAKALKGVNQEQLALYYGIGRFISYNSREGFWGKGAIATISEQLRREIPGLRGFSPSNLKSMRAFYEEWKSLEATSPVMTGELQVADSENNKIRQLQLANFSNFPWTAFLSIGFTHHCIIITKVKDVEERKFYIQLCADLSLSVDALERKIAEDAYHNQGKMPNNFGVTIPDYKRAFQAIQMFKDDSAPEYSAHSHTDSTADESALNHANLGADKHDAGRSVEGIAYKCAWSPYEGATLKGLIDRVFINGSQVITGGSLIQDSPSGQPIAFCNL